MSYALDRVAGWMASVAIVTVSYRLTEDVGIVAIFVLTQVLARLLAGPLVANIVPRAGWSLLATDLVRIAALGSLALVSSRDDLSWAFVAIGLLAGASGVVEGVQSRLVPQLASRRGLPVLSRLIGRIEQLSAVIGPVVAGVILFTTDEAAVFALAAPLIAVSMVLLHRHQGLLRETLQQTPEQRPPANNVALTQMLHHPVLRLVGIALLAVAALGAVIRVILIDVVVDDLDYARGHYGLLLGLVGLGALAGPLPIHKVLGRISIGTVATGSVVALALGMVLLVLAQSVVIALPILFTSGLVIVTFDLVASVTMRRVIAEDDLDGAARITKALVLGGQLVGLIAVLGLSRLWSTSMVIILIGAAWILGLVLLFFISNGPRLTLATISPSTHHLSPEDGDGA